MLCDFCVGDAEEIVEGAVDTIEVTFSDAKYETASAKTRWTR